MGYFEHTDIHVRTDRLIHARIRLGLARETLRQARHRKGPYSIYGATIHFYAALDELWAAQEAMKSTDHTLPNPWTA